LLTTSTLAKLRETYPEGRWYARRFRPNIVVEAGDGEGYVEDDWIGKKIALGDEVHAQMIDTMSRCVMTTLPQGDLPNDPAILRTLADHHRVLMPALGKELPAVGVAVTVTAGGRISQGDRIAVGPTE
jgi:MOSC domain-containing protein